MKKLQQGFTMIELLIVIAVLGILAVAVLSAINPIEQINRGRDTGTRSDTEQLISAIDRYYTIKGYYPWMIDAQSVNYAVSPLTEIVTEADTFGVDLQPVLTNLSTGATQEIKKAFTQRITGGSTRHLWLYHGLLDSDSTFVCFIPQSSAFRDEAFKRCTTVPSVLPLDFPPTACPAGATCMGAATASDATGCYICLP